MAGRGIRRQLTVFKNTNPSDELAPRSNGDVKAVLVRNVSGVALLPKLGVSWKAGKRGTEVDGYVNETGGELAGVVDDHLGSAGVPNNDVFWVIYDGPCLCTTTAAAGATSNIAEGDTVQAATAAASTHSTTAGRVQGHNSAGPISAAETTNGYAFKLLRNAIGHAMSARTTAETNNDILVDVKTYKA